MSKSKTFSVKHGSRDSVHTDDTKTLTECRHSAGDVLRRVIDVQDDAFASQTVTDDVKDDATSTSWPPTISEVGNFKQDCVIEPRKSNNANDAAVLTSWPSPC